MSFDPDSLFASIMIGLVGMALLAYGKSQKRAPQIVVGFALLGYPYFVSSVPWMIAIAVGLVGLMAVAIKWGRL